MLLVMEHELRAKIRGKGSYGSGNYWNAQGDGGRYYANAQADGGKAAPFGKGLGKPKGKKGKDKDKGK